MQFLYLINSDIVAINLIMVRKCGKEKLK